MTKDNSKSKRKKSKLEFEEGQVPGSIIVPTKYKLIKLILFLIILGSVILIFPILRGLGPWLENPGLKGPYLSWSEDPRTTMTITWQTPEKCNSIIDFALSTSTDFTNTSTNSTLTLSHSFTLINLTPNTEYKYKINTSTRDNLWGLEENTYSFKTAPNSSVPFKFVLYGDIRPGTFNEGYHKRVVNAILTEPDFKFTLDVGDLVYRPNNLENWDRFFWDIKDLAANRPYMCALGNHEYDEGSNPDYGANYFQFFSFPQNGKNEFYYSFNYSNVHIASLNMSTSDLIISQEEINWLDNDLTNANNSNMWKIVFFHVPPYSSAAHGENQEIIEKMVPIFEKHKVVVFCGHDHHYEHDRVNNIDYFIIGGGGAPLEVALKPKPYMIYGEITFCYSLIDINGDSMIVTTKRIDGSIVDKITINRLSI